VEAVDCVSPNEDVSGEDEDSPCKDAFKGDGGDSQAGASNGREDAEEVGSGRSNMTDAGLVEVSVATEAGRRGACGMQLS
jgi:hypothetical protein